ncbi:MAG: hypothetical protein GX594_16190 [Pirellulaceae bacterium]|nr:hypothetical protein [Pirellulaceae bacterium]
MKTYLIFFGRSLRRGYLWAALFMIASALGCNQWDMHDDGFGNDELGAPARNMRSESNDIDYWGYNPKARQIEQNLHRQ